jgi:NAD(P)H-dependent flavin oxidoreductase YrpB (nitropropane dioxygenase family)
VDAAPLPVGQSIGLIKGVKTCRQIIVGMVKEAEEALSRAQSRFGD